jgi:hypothetical protein
LRTAIDINQSMIHPSGPATDGERLLAAYLRQRRLHHRYEAPVGGRNPDFLVVHPIGEIVMEVFEPHLRLPSRVGSFDSVEPVLGAFEKRKRRQVQAAANQGIPTVVVIASTNSDIPFDMFALGGAMFGRLGIRFSTDAPEDQETTFLGPGRTQPHLNTSYSALAVVRRFNPTRWRLDMAWAVRAQPGTDLSSRELTEVSIRRREIAEEMERIGTYDPTAALARLVILHNPYAKVRLPFEFGGPHDHQYGAIESAEGTRQWCRLAEGRLRQEVPKS